MQKKLLSLSLIFVIVFTLFPFEKNTVVYAESRNGETTKSPWRTSDNERFLYEFEAGIPEDEESGFFDLTGKVDDKIVQAKGEVTLLIVNFIFSINKFFTNGLIVILDLTSNTIFIDKFIDQIGDKITDVVGISNGEFVNNGMFKMVLQLTSMLVILYAFYKLVWRRSFVESFGEMFKFVVVLVAALLLFANYGTFISGMNQLGTEVSGFVASLTTGSGNEERVDGFGEALWGHFVDKPYLEMQYGVSNINELSGGENRVRSLLKAGKGTEKRAEIIEKEMNELGNYQMTYDSVGGKLFRSVMFLIFNAIASIPILMLALALFFTQFWYVIIAMLAPFALLVASFPSMFNVLKRYSFELILPLLIRVVLGFVLVLLMFLTDVVRVVITEHFTGLGSRGILLSFVNALFIGMLFMGIFLLRKRLMDILSSGSDVVGDIRQALGNLTINLAKNAVKGTTTLVGATLGTAVAGPQGGMIGAGMGNTAGKAVTGGTQGFDGAVRDVVDMSYKHQMLKDKFSKNIEDKIENPDVANMNDYTGENNTMQYDKPNTTDGKHDEKVTNEKSTTHDLPTKNKDSGVKYNEYQKKLGMNEFTDYMAEKGFNEKEINEYKKAFDENDVDFAMVDRETLDKHFNSELVKENKHNPQVFANGVHDEVEQLKVNRRDDFDNFLKDQNLTKAEISHINDDLNKKSIDIETIPMSHYRDVDKDIRSQMESGQVVDYKTAFIDGIEKKVEQDNLNLSSLNDKDQEPNQEVVNQKTSVAEIPQTQLKNNKESSKEVEASKDQAPVIEENPIKDSATTEKEIQSNRLETKKVKEPTFDVSPIKGSELENSKIDGKELKQNQLSSSETTEYKKENNNKDTIPKNRSPEEINFEKGSSSEAEDPKSSLERGEDD